MRRMPFTLALYTLLSSATIVASGVALAEPPATPERTSAEAAPPSRSPTDTGNTAARALTVRGVESSSPTTPMPMNLPDEATASEVKNQYAIGITGLIAGGVLIAALVAGVIFLISRRSWSTSH
jgi:hypothetical protein